MTQNAYYLIKIMLLLLHIVTCKGFAIQDLQNRLAGCLCMGSRTRSTPVGMCLACMFMLAFTDICISIQSHLMPFYG